jgi:RHS repeat-associated protein
VGSEQDVDNVAYAFVYHYNDRGGPLSYETYPSGRIVNYTYDSAGQADSAVKGNPGTTCSGTNCYASEVKYAVHGGMQVGTFGPMTQTSGYNGQLQVNSMVAKNGSTTLWSLSNTYDAPLNDGNIVGQTVDATGAGGLSVSTAYTYDGLNRLASSTESGSGTASQGYGYDSVGNRWVTGGVTLSPYTPVTANWYDGATNRISNTQFQHDGLGTGNVTVMGGYGMEYDAENRMTKATIGSSTTQYWYDGEGRRVKKQTGNLQATVYVYDAGGELAAEYGAAGTASGTEYLVQDHLGTTRLVVDGSGLVLGLHDYLPFGEELVSGVSGRTSVYGRNELAEKFTGKERDSELASSAMQGLDYFGARYFSGAVGRWTTVDPSYESQIMELPQTWNRYAYVYNRPTFATDPDGRCPPCAGAIIGGVGEGLWNLGTQLYQHRGDITEVSGRQVAASFAGGAIAGALAVVTGGGALAGSALLGDAAAGAFASVAGGIVERTANGEDAGEVFSTASISIQAAFGFLGGVGGHLAADVIHVPEDPALPGPRRHAIGRRRLAQYDATIAANNRDRMFQAGTNTTVGVATAHTVEQGAKHFWNILDWLIFSTPPQQRNGTTSIFHPCRIGDTAERCSGN